MRNRSRKLLIGFLTAFLLCGVFALAIADEDVIMQPTADDLPQQEALDIAIAFFSQKCGLDEATLSKADWDCVFGETMNQEAGTREPHWSLTARNIPDEESGYVMILSRQGELLYWKAHGSKGYTTANPDLLTDATFIQPLESDAQENAVLQATKDALVARKAYTAAEIKTLSLQAYFMYHPQFNDGNSPVWLVTVTNGETMQWKAVYGYNGVLMSLVPGKQDFTCYTLPGENFWESTFAGEDYTAQMNLLTGVIDGSLSLDERAKITAGWRPYVQQWIADHP